MTASYTPVYALGLSDLGKKRDHNEDCIAIFDDLNLFIVADGMGGHAGGEIASKLAVETIEQVIRNNLHILNSTQVSENDIEQNPIAKLLSDALRCACHVVHQKSIEEPSLQGMGTTATALLLCGKYGFVAHVGDSRAYLIRDGKIAQLSEDHSLINEQLKAGLITPTQARYSRFRNVITRSIGFEDDVDVDMIALDTLANDALILCSDGLTSLVTEEEINHICNSYTIHEIPQILVDLANQRGGDDNISVIVVYLIPKVKRLMADDAKSQLRILQNGSEFAEQAP